MDAEQIFKELMKSDDLQTLLDITEEEASDANFNETSTNCPKIEIIKDVINGVANRKSDNTVYQGIVKKLS